MDLSDPALAIAEAVPGASPQRVHSLARAARHDILRRLAPPLRHDMVVPLQALGMTAEAMSARLDRGALAAEDLARSMAKLNRLAREAVARCLEVCGWMEPPDDDTVALRDGVAEVVRLLSTSLSFRGFDLRMEVADGEFAVSRSAARFLLAGCVFALADAAPAPGAITVRTEHSSAHGVVAVDYQPQQDGSFTQWHEPGEAPLSWPEVQALATEHGVELLRNGQAILLRMPRAVVTSPLTMAPV